jgi:hypothetical protein
MWHLKNRGGVPPEVVETCLVGGEVEVGDAKLRRPWWGGARRAPQRPGGGGG